MDKAHFCSRHNRPYDFYIEVESEYVCYLCEKEQVKGMKLLREAVHNAYLEAGLIQKDQSK